MSEKVVTLAAVEAAIAAIEKSGTKASADRVLKLTGGSKSTVLRYYNQLRETPAMTENTNTGDGDMALPPELGDALQKAAKSLSAIPQMFRDALKRHDAAISFHAKEELSREIAVRDDRIAALEAELNDSRQRATAAEQTIEALERELTWAKTCVLALGGRENAATASAMMKPEAEVAICGRGAEPPSARPCIVDYPEPFLIKPEASSQPESPPSPSLSQPSADE